MPKDIITHIEGYTNAGDFATGANTPAPYNGTHTGLVDGTSPATSTKNMAEIYNRLLLEKTAMIELLGEAVDNENWAQLAFLLKNKFDSADNRLLSHNKKGSASVHAGNTTVTATTTFTAPRAGRLTAMGSVVYSIENPAQGHSIELYVNGVSVASENTTHSKVVFAAVDVPAGVVTVECLGQSYNEFSVYVAYDYSATE